IQYEIRKGEEKDIPDLMALIRELAEFEKAPEKVVTNEEILQKDWQQHKAFDFLVAEMDGRVVGISLYYPRYSTWNGRCYYLEDLYIQPEARGMGAGKALLLATVEEAKKAGAGRLDWQVLDWNEGAVRFYESLGAHIEEEWWNCKLLIE
ncbi:MAG: GNAT family N-acetyltransferase, partial [Owenweeksia sp.]